MSGNDAGAYWGIAATRRGRIAVYVAHCNARWPARLPIAADAWQLYRVSLSASSNWSLEGGVTENRAWFSAQL